MSGDAIPRERTGLLALGTVLLVQWGGLFLIQLGEVDTSSSILPIVLLGLSLVAALLYRIEARQFAEQGSTWWQPDYRWWVVSALPFGINLGVYLGFLLRRSEALRWEGPSTRWKRIAVGGAVVSAIGTTVFRFGSGGELPVVVLAAVSLLSLNAVGLSVVAIVYDVKNVSAILAESDTGWLFDGHHWIVLVALLIPANLLFALIYLVRRRQILARGGKQEPAVAATTDGAGNDDTGDPPERL